MVIESNDLYTLNKNSGNVELSLSYAEFFAA